MLLLFGLSSAALADDFTDPRDPFEKFNRTVFRFNETLDKAALKPLAEGYRTITPVFIQSGIRNFFSNLDDVTVFANDSLQLKGKAAVNDLLRVTFNTSLGILGLIDVASEIGLKKRDQDFGVTLGYWGVGEGPYLVLPVLGPSSLRDASGRLIDKTYFDPLYNRDVIPKRTSVMATNVITRRAEVLGAKRALDEAALDLYEFSRDIYLERSESRLYEGHPPRQE